MEVVKGNVPVRRNQKRRENATNHVLVKYNVSHFHFPITHDTQRAHATLQSLGWYSSVRLWGFVPRYNVIVLSIGNVQGVQLTTQWKAYQVESCFE